MRECGAGSMRIKARRRVLFGDETDDENDEDRRAAFFVLKRELLFGPSTYDFTEAFVWTE